MGEVVKRSYRRKRVRAGPSLALREGLWKEDEETEENLLNSKTFGKEVVKKVEEFNDGNLKQVLEWLLLEKPAQLDWGREHYLDVKEMEETWKGLCAKFEIHGYEDRGERLDYLWKVLRAQFANKVTTFKIMVQFLILMAQRPTGVTYLPLETCQYSAIAEEDEQYNKEQQRQLLLEILGEGDPEGMGDHSYSSDESLSEWSDLEDEEMPSEKSGNDIPPIKRPVRTSSSFGEFKDILKETNEEALARERRAASEAREKERREAVRYWTGQQAKEIQWMNENVRRFETVRLQSQPVISSRLVLLARFGEHWEWKQRDKRRHGEMLELEVAFTEDVIREILWHFVDPNPAKSALFQEDWKVKENLMVASLSKATFDQFVNKFGVILGKLQALRRFSNDILSQCHPEDDCATYTEDIIAPSKVLRNYANALQDISFYIMDRISDMERKIMLPPQPRNSPAYTPACTTFIQLDLQTQDLCEIIKLVYQAHINGVSQCKTQAEPTTKNNPTLFLPWQQSVYLLSSLEHHLLREVRPPQHGVLLFLFAKSLYGILDEILTSVKTLEIEDRYSLFTKNDLVQINNVNFWAECIKIRNLDEVVPSSSLTSLKQLLPKILKVLKTCEVFHELEEDFTQIVASANAISLEKLIQEFLEQVLEKPPKQSDIEKSSKEPNYLKEFLDLGLEDSQAINCFRFLFEDCSRTSVKAQKVASYTLADLWGLNKCPVKTYSQLLDCVFERYFDPFCLSAKVSIENIFRNYKVLEKIQLFQEIILCVREDFARGIIDICGKKLEGSSGKGFEEESSRNGQFQRWLNTCYPLECRGDSFTVELRRSSNIKWEFKVETQFPLNLVVTPSSIKGYLFIGQQLQKIRQSLWAVNGLSLRTCCESLKTGLDLDTIKSRMMALREFAEYADKITRSNDGDDMEDLDKMRKLHEKYLDAIQTKMLREETVEKLLIPRMGLIAEKLKTVWTTGISQTQLMKLEHDVKMCWQLVNKFGDQQRNSQDFQMLSWHYGPPPSYLTN